MSMLLKQSLAEGRYKERHSNLGEPQHQVIAEPSRPKSRADEVEKMFTVAEDYRDRFRHFGTPLWPQSRSTH